MNLPQARTGDIIEQSFGAEMLIYDLLTDRAYTLNETSAAIYQVCDGQTSFDELKRRHGFTDELIYLALDELKRSDLLADGAAYRSPFAGINRREVLKRIGLTSASALPVIFSLIAPPASSAASGEVCIFDNPCSCSVINNSGSAANCGEELGGTSRGCGSGNGAGCDCYIPNGGNGSGTCIVFL
jgi:hypothetical protein